MQLHHLNIKKYNNLNYFELEFKQPLTILAGNNGSGKSNLLEALSGIFRNAERRSRPYNPECDYSLSYDLGNDKFYNLSKENGGLSFTKQQSQDAKETTDVTSAEGTLPYLVAVYSGEDDRLRKFYPQSGSHDALSRPRFWYLNRDYWMSALLTLLLSEEVRNNNSMESLLQVDLKSEDIQIQVNKAALAQAKAKSDANFKTFLDTLSQQLEPKAPNDTLSIDVFKYAGDTITGGKTELFRVLYKASQGKTPIISDIFIPVKETEHGNTIQEKISLSALSEGEKKMILIGAVLETFGDNETLLLLDEPDAHVHESRKQDLLTFLYKHRQCQIVMTTHSIELARSAVNEEKGQVVLLTKDGPRDDFSDFTDDFWRIHWNDIRTVVIFEGSSDVRYVERAREKLEFPLPNVSFTCGGGASNAKHMLSFLREHFSDKRVLFFFDRDEAGHKGATTLVNLLVEEYCKPTEEQIGNALAKAQKNRPDITRDTIINQLSQNKKDEWHAKSSWPPFQKEKDYTDFSANDYPVDCKRKNITVHFLPKKPDAPEGDFLIEDYFSFPNTAWENILKPIFLDDKNQAKNLSLNELPDTKAKVKGELIKLLPTLDKDAFEGFRVLLETIKQYAEKS